jgi:hypothetical protein
MGGVWVVAVMACSSHARLQLSVAWSPACLSPPIFLHRGLGLSCHFAPRSASTRRCNPVPFIFRLFAHSLTSPSCFVCCLFAVCLLFVCCLFAVIVAGAQVLARSSVTDGADVAAKGRGASLLGIDMQPNPFFDPETAEEGHAPASLAFRYRKVPPPPLCTAHPHAHLLWPTAASLVRVEAGAGGWGGGGCSSPVP